jgi:uncharacterized protein YeaC (DUF1315 family)
LDSIYRPGLVYSNKPNEKRYYLRDSADGVAIMRRTAEEREMKMKMIFSFQFQLNVNVEPMSVPISVNVTTSQHYRARLTTSKDTPTSMKSFSLRFMPLKRHPMGQHK